MGSNPTSTALTCDNDDVTHGWVRAEYRALVSVCGLTWSRWALDNYAVADTPIDEYSGYRRTRMSGQNEELQGVKLRTLVIIGAAFVVGGIALAVVIPEIPFGTPPLGTAANWSAGLQCSAGKTLANGFYELQNYSGETVTVTGVHLLGGAGQKMTSAAYLVPIQHTLGTWLLIGLVPPWPPTSPMWKLPSCLRGRPGALAALVTGAASPCAETARAAGGSRPDSIAAAPPASAVCRAPRP